MTPAAGRLSERTGARTEVGGTGAGPSPEASFRVEDSPVDSGIFGVRVARAVGVTSDDVTTCLAHCEREQTDMLVARCPTDDLAAVHAMTAHGFTLMDCLVHFKRDLRDLPAPFPFPDAVIRTSTAADAEAVGDVAARCFADYTGHYHADPRLDAAACTEVYASWGRADTATSDPGTAVIVAERDDEVVGFLSLVVRDRVAAAVLAGVLPEHRSRRMLEAITVERLRLSAELGATTAVSSYLLTNVAVQRSAVNSGFRPSHSEYTFHRWWDRT